MRNYVDIVFPSAVRKPFTYHIDQEEHSNLQLGSRVWVPFRNYFAIGVVVNIHRIKPEFSTKAVEDVLDQIPVLNESILKLTSWVHQFYYCSWGEVIQAALPSGLNFISKKYVRLGDVQSSNLTDDEEAFLEEFKGQEQISHTELVTRSRTSNKTKLFNSLIRKEYLKIWEVPVIKTVESKVKIWNPSKDLSLVQKTLTEKKLKKWELALQKLNDLSFPIEHSELIQIEEFSNFTIKKLKSEGWIVDSFINESEREKKNTAPTVTPKALNDEQRNIFSSIEEAIDKKAFDNFLLYGITGSGKTEIYIHALERVKREGNGGIILVPEIALTPQTVSRFKDVFGEDVAVLHSRMSNKERLSEWKALESGKKNIVIGPRSAVFAPIQNLGLIILDEEHDGSYKQEDPAPRYHAREVAIMRATIESAIVIMGSATPSMQALSMVHRNKAKLLELKNRHGEARLPEIKIVDLKEYKSAMRGSLSIELFETIQNSLSRNEQVILLYNRRGFGSYLQCNACGNIPQSPESSVSLTYHKHKNLLLDHYSGYSRKADTYCETCGSSELTIQGLGTQRIEEELVELFPEARILRFDKDSTSRKGAHQQILNNFEQQKADILVGTQLVAKGLNFPNVTTVGVIDADTEQAFPSFNSSERLYQLLSQVSGRSGRAEKKGKVVIQTRQSENEVIQFAKIHDHKGFSKHELAFRKELNYPPFSRMVKFVLKGSNEQLVIQQSHIMRSVLEKLLPTNQVLGPASAAIGWINKNFIWELYLKIGVEKGASYIEALLSAVMHEYEISSGKNYSKIRVNINVDSIR